MTDDQLKAIAARNEQRKARKAKAAEGPWGWKTKNRAVGGHSTWVTSNTMGNVFSSPLMMDDDADFICAARNDPVEADVDELLAEIRRLRGEGAT